MHCRVSAWSYTSNTKLFCLELGAYSIIQSLYGN